MKALPFPSPLIYFYFYFYFLCPGHKKSAYGILDVKKNGKSLEGKGFKDYVRIEGAVTLSLSHHLLNDG